jgi:hypothetical protein
MPTHIRPLPEFLRFKKDMEAAGEIVAIYDDGTPFVHTTDVRGVMLLTKVGTDYFAESFDGGATKCVFPVPVDDDQAETHKLAAVGRENSLGRHQAAEIAM